VPISCADAASWVTAAATVCTLTAMSAAVEATTARLACAKLIAPTALVHQS
jgi:hypothetical protein